MNLRRPSLLRRALRAWPLALALALPVRAQSTLSELSLISTLPVAVLVAVPAVALSGATLLTVKTVEASAHGALWVLERASDGAQFSLRLGAQAAGASAVAVGTGVSVTVLGAGWLLHAAGRTLAFVPNASGKALLYHERVTW